MSKEPDSSSAGLVLPLDVRGIEALLPHRFPFLLVDRVIEFVENERITGVKNVSANEWFFQGHFPGQPIMPGVLVLEALAQLGALFARMSSDGVPASSLMVFSGVESLRFRRQVVPGDVLTLEMKLQRRRLALWKMEGRALVAGEAAAEGVLMATEVKA